MSKVYTEKKCLSDLLKWECNPLYCRGVMTITAGAEDVEIAIGQPFVRSTGTGLAAENVSTVDCLALENTIVPAGETAEIRVLNRAPAIISVSGLDVAADQLDAVKTRLETLGFVFVSEPEKTATQTT